MEKQKNYDNILWIKKLTKNSILDLLSLKFQELQLKGISNKTEKQLT